MEPGRKDCSRRSRGFTLIEVLIVISIITFLMGVLVVAFTGVRKRALKAKTMAQLEAIEAAFSQYYMYFHKYPPDSHPTGSDLDGIENSECAVYYLMTAFRVGENMPHTTTKPSIDAGPFLDVDKEMLKDDAADGVDGHMSLIDPMGKVWFYDKAPEAADYPQAHINVASYNLWSGGIDGKNDLGDNDDIANWMDIE